jgi:CheY-like chemotaxis protein
VLKSTCPYIICGVSEEIQPDMKLRTKRALGYGGIESICRSITSVTLGLRYLAVGRESWSVQKNSVVLVDQKSSKVDGLDLPERIKTDSGLKPMLDSSREERDLQSNYDLGTNIYVVEPMSFKDFIEVVREVGLFWGTINQSPGTTEWKA